MSVKLFLHSAHNLPRHFSFVLVFHFVTNVFYCININLVCFSKIIILEENTSTPSKLALNHLNMVS